MYRGTSRVVHSQLYQRKAVFIVLIVLANVVCAYCVRVERATDVKGMRVGGRQKIVGAQNDLQLEDLAKFAVEQHNLNQNSDLQYVSLVSAEQQLVAGTMYYLDIEATLSGDATKLYEAKVWVKPWLSFKSLEDFKEIQSIVPQSSVANFVEGNDQVMEAAKHALMDLQAKSNSLDPYELNEVILVHAQVVDRGTSYELLLRVQRGSQEEQIKVEVVHTDDNLWIVKDVHPFP